MYCLEQTQTLYARYNRFKLQSLKCSVDDGHQWPNQHLMTTRIKFRPGSVPLRFLYSFSYSRMSKMIGNNGSK